MRNTKKAKSRLLKAGDTQCFCQSKVDYLTFRDSNKSKKVKRSNFIGINNNYHHKCCRKVVHNTCDNESKISANSEVCDDGLDRNKVLSENDNFSDVVNSLAKALDKESISNLYSENEKVASSTGIHTLFHYTPNNKVEKIKFAKDDCPVCNYLKRQRLQSESSIFQNHTQSVEFKSNRFRVKSASDTLDHQLSDCSSPSSSTLSFTFEFSYPTDSDGSDSAFCNGISVDLTNCKNVTFKVEKLSEKSIRHYHTSSVSNSTCLPNNDVAYRCYCSNDFLLSNFTSLPLSPYVSVLVPNSLKKCFFCHSNLTICYECRKNTPGSFSNFSYSCNACKTCNYNEYSDLISRAACIIAEPIQSSRQNDIFDSLKTCLIPHTFLSYYKNVQPPDRIWHIIDKPLEGLSFTIMCYNVLCQKYATTSMYPYCPTFALDWEYRKLGILEEIYKYDADIICLQELETSQYENVFSVELRKRKYDSLFVPKSRSRTMHESDSKFVDGCAIFWKIDSFDKVHHFTHEFMLSCFSVSKNPSHELLNRVMNRDNVALSLILEAKDPKMNRRKLCVSTGHIHWDPEYSDVKLIQTLFWTSELWNSIREYYKKNSLSNISPSEMPIIFCGDFNSLPNSGVIDYLMKGEVDRSHVDFRDFGDKYLFDEWTAIQEEFVENDVLRHHFNFDRGYKDERDSGLKWTNFTYDFRGIIDYIFFSKDHLKLLGNLKQIDEAWFDQHKIIGAPHVHVHSDHFSLLVELELLRTPISLQTSEGKCSTNNYSNNSQIVTAQSRLNSSFISNISNSSSSNGSNSAAGTTAASIASNNHFPYRSQSTWS